MAEAVRLLLGAKAASIHDIRLPAFCSYKLDGWRGLWQGLEFLTRNGKTIPNRSLQRAGQMSYLTPGYDGEIIIGEPNAPDVFDKTNRFCKKMAGHTLEQGHFFVFDNAAAEGPYWKRLETIIERPPFLIRLDQHLIETYDDLEEFEANAVSFGYEGVVARAPNGRYKNGRSTLKEQYLVKLKRYLDEEVKIIGFEELLHNANPAFISETGYTKRSSHADGKIPAGTLGKIIVDWRGHQLRVGTGFSSKDRAHIWQRRDYFLGKSCTIRYSPPTKDLPRQPVWKGIRGDI